jgi:hypothetical protein
MGDHDENKPGDAKNELALALSHLKNAAGLLVGAADPAVRKAASEAERMLTKVGAEAEPMAQKLGAELGKMTRSIVEAIEGKKPGEAEEKDESEVERLEREADADAKKR